MRKMSEIFGLMLLVLLLSSGASEALGREKKPATSGETAKEYAKQAVRDTANAAQNVGEALVASGNHTYGLKVHKPVRVCTVLATVLMVACCTADIER